MLTKAVLEKIAPFYKLQYGSKTEEIFLGLINHQKKVSLKNTFLDENLSKEYFLDKASMLSPHALPIKEGMRVLDMCSAPGGKLLSLINRQIPKVSYVANDISLNRLNRLKNVLKSYVPKDFLINNVKTTCKDGLKFGLLEPEGFDAILLDAPCSNEGHLVKDEKFINKFKGLNKSLPKKQYGLLCSALLALKPNGQILYLTCSINQNENDLVIERLLKKKGEFCQSIDIDLKIGEKTKYGIQVLPHLHDAGPLYFGLIKKV